ncbi:hypothetical protein J671_1538 [Acinetobacter sp. 1130196]|uniref:hypothetical protein n=1 Tax=Acinetobacter TaxID=469 RepID=UPI0004504EBF|nr:MULTISPECIES: hypothetical protein [Acinetobacter]EKU6035133.1 hypothetical protein [Acinetobacter nosocomialis]EXR18208.1 hypothetical protein J671_1538 [Acinetobacter sp. 1130196]MDR7655022.1 hypothetical protein [Acinetobacter junii]OTL04409.1 hypothetical protein B9X83_05290 [Acinetobacter nosocomialis]OTU50220.1 hypothetical protein CAT56_03640 [Acinetobacter nosocomialis]
MVTITLAKSLETGQIITTAEADHQRELGNIKSKYLFECIDENCDAQITCANLLKEVSKRKKEPYYIYVGDHTPACKEKDKIEKIERELQERQESKPRRYISDKFAFLNLDKPSTKKTETATQGASALTDPTTNSSGTTNGQSQFGVRPSKKALSSWVKLFNDDADISVIYNDEEIHIRDLFVNMDEVTNIEDLEEEPKIYYGTAWINPKPNGIQFTFSKKVQLDELNQNPSLMLYTNKIANEAENGRFSEKTLKQLAARRTKNNKPQPITVYIFSQLPPQLSKNGKFINFYAKELTYIYYEK